MTIPASTIVSINPQVVSAGGNSLAMNGLVLTQDAAVPIGTVKSFATAQAVADFFGASSNEYAWAVVYFQGRNNATAYPSSLLFAQYNTAAVAAYLRSASLATMTLAQLQALSGVLTLTVDGTPFTSSTINLAAATSFSNAATIIQAAFTTPNFTVSYDAQRAAFKFTSNTTGATSTITFATGTLSAALYLTAATGAETSQGADIAVAATFMNNVIGQTQNWGIFSTLWLASDADKLALAAWVNGQNERYCFVNWDDNVLALSTPDTTTAQAQIIAASYSGIAGVYCDATLDPTGLAAAMILGIAASIDWARTNGRITFAFKYTDGVPVSITDQTYAANLEANGYNFIGQWATANQGFSFFYPGAISGSYSFIDEYVNQIYLNSQFQLFLMDLLTALGSIPYNDTGYGYVAAALQDPINSALNFGSIVPGVSLSAVQIAEVNAAAGTLIDGVLSKRGWYLQVKDPGATVRAARGTPIVNFWYMDGGSIQKISMPSILVQ